MSNEMLSIKEVVRKTGLTSRTIRFYEEMGLITSSPRQPGTLRSYPETELAKLQHICELKELLGFSLEEIKMFIEIEANCQAQRQKYYSLTNPEEKKNLLKQGITALSQMRWLAVKRLEKLKFLVASLDSKLISLERELKEVQKQEQEQRKEAKTAVKN
jgi:DNA-binding transcriptional MerR regulator